MAVQETRQALDRLAKAAAGADAEHFRTLLDTSRAAVRDYLMSVQLEGAPPGFTSGYVGDALQRFIHTLQFVPLPAGGRILELGANPYFFHLLLRRFFGGSTLQGANFFDRNVFSGEIGSATHRLKSGAFDEEWVFTYPVFNLEVVPRYPFPAASFDLIFFCETMEHLVVNPLPVLRKIRRLLSPGGYLVVSLPNALRLTNLACFLDGFNFFDLYHPETGIHGRHNREFTLPEMKKLLSLHGLLVRRAETRDRFDYDRVTIQAVDYSGAPFDLTRRRRELYQILRFAGGTLEDRGDNLYLLAQRAMPASDAPMLRPERGLTMCDPPSAEPERARAYVDSLQDDARRLAVVGWGFLTDEVGSGDEWVKLVLRCDDRCHAALCERMFRRDVADTFGLDREDPGFEVEIDKARLRPGVYRLGLLMGGPGLPDGFHDLGIDTVVK